MHSIIFATFALIAILSLYMGGLWAIAGRVTGRALTLAYMGAPDFKRASHNVGVIPTLVVVVGVITAVIGGHTVVQAQSLPKAHCGDLLVDYSIELENGETMSGSQFVVVCR
jgi:hypothetical protein